MSRQMECIALVWEILKLCPRRGKRHGLWLGMLALLILTGIPAARATEVPSAGNAAADAGEAVEMEHGKINTPDASPVDPGQVEVEAGYTTARSTRYWDNQGETWNRGLAREQAATLAVTAGVVENVDVAVGGGYVWLKDEENDYAEGDGVVGPTRGHDWGDMDISVRYRFFARDELSLELAYIAGLTLPAGSDSSANSMGTSQEYWSINQTVVASKDWDRWTANLALGYSLPVGDKREQARGTFNADAAVVAVTAGLVMPVSDRLRINAGVQQGLWGSNADKATTLSLALKLAF